MGQEADQHPEKVHFAVQAAQGPQGHDLLNVPPLHAPLEALVVCHAARPRRELPRPAVPLEASLRPPLPHRRHPHRGAADQGHHGVDRKPEGQHGRRQALLLLAQGTRVYRHLPGVDRGVGHIRLRAAEVVARVVGQAARRQALRGEREADGGHHQGHLDGRACRQGGQPAEDGRPEHAGGATPGLSRQGRSRGGEQERLRGSANREGRQEELRASRPDGMPDPPGHRAGLRGRWRQRHGEHVAAPQQAGAPQASSLHGLGLVIPALPRRAHAVAGPPRVPQEDRREPEDARRRADPERRPGPEEREARDLGLHHTGCELRRPHPGQDGPERRGPLPLEVPRSQGGGPACQVVPRGPTLLRGLRRLVRQRLARLRCPRVPVLGRQELGQGRSASSGRARGGPQALLHAEPQRASVRSLGLPQHGRPCVTLWPKPRKAGRDGGRERR
mmetsp:Transcript_124776/g.388426  ORF Transcript_124776/g.388426 Transcript_124776/m.388426 type:complete len:446 (+) Transcript_124776:1317-2654(+)